MELEYLRNDINDLITKPKEAFKRIINYENRFMGAIFLFIAGFIFTIEQIIVTEENFKVIKETMGVSTAMASAQKDGLITAAVMLPFILVGLWYLLAFVTDFLAEKMGGFKGSYNDILTAYCYIALFLAVFMIITLPLFLLDHTAGLKIFGVIYNILAVIFTIWLFYMSATAVEVIYEMPFSNAFIVILISYFMLVLFASLFYFIVGQLVVPSFRKGHYEPF